MQKTVHGLVLRQTAYKEYDMILTVLTAEEGRLTVNARGAGRPKSVLAAASQLLCYSRMQLSEYRDRHSLTEAEVLDSFPGLRGDVEALALGFYLCDAAALFMPEQEAAEEIHSLMLLSLRLLSKGEREPRFIKAVTEFAALCRAGFAPELSVCARCGHEAAPLSFDTSEGLLHCRDCASQESFLLSGGVLAALRHIRNAPLGKLFGFTLNDAESESLAAVTERYFLDQTGKYPASLAYYRELQRMEARS